MKKQRRVDPEKHRIAAKAYRLAHPEQIRALAKVRWQRRKADPVQREHSRLRLKEWNRQHRFAQYGMTEAEYWERVARQEGQCVICRRTNKLLVIDHDHATNQVRDLLCARCNTIVGYLESARPLIETAEQYLARWGRP